MTLLSVEGISVAYGLRAVIHNVSFSVRERCVTTLLGANGAGKTTILKAISGLVRAKGTIRLDGRVISKVPAHAIARMGVAHVPEGRGTFPALTVEENLKVGSISRDAKDFGRETERVYDYFPRLAERKTQQAGTLSGGEQQMLAIARALMLRPRLLILDEPSFGVAPLIVTRIFEILQKLRHEEAIAMLLIEQNAKLALEIADDAHLIETGKLALSGTAQELRANEAVKRYYLGY